MTHRRLTLVLAAALVLAPARAQAYPIAESLPTDHVRLTSGPGTLGILERVFVLPQGTHVLAPPAWDKLDLELHRLQDAETRLTAENTYMRNRVKGWTPGWKTLATTMLTSIATGIYIGRKL